MKRSIISARRQIDMINIDVNSKDFWNISALGLVGSVTGVLGFIISLATFKYKTPKIQIDKALLIIPDETVKDLKKPKPHFSSPYLLEYKLEIVVGNQHGGAGSIDKPNLIISIPNRKIGPFKKRNKININPVTTRYEYEGPDNGHGLIVGVSKVKTIREGKSFNLGPGEKVDAEITYAIRNKENIKTILEYFEKADYFIEYSDNNGKHHAKKISNVIKSSEHY